MLIKNVRPGDRLVTLREYIPYLFLAEYVGTVGQSDYQNDLNP
jgi:hypothetical protein